MTSFLIDLLNIVQLKCFILTFHTTLLHTKQTELKSYTEHVVPYSFSKIGTEQKQHPIPSLFAFSLNI